MQPPDTGLQIRKKKDWEEKWFPCSGRDLSMLHKFKDALGFRVEAIDGYIGTLADIYFDDQEWSIRYFVINTTGENSTDQKVLISPLAVGEPDWSAGSIPVSLTKKKIKSSPQSEIDLPISRQYEIALRRYYEWPIYWGQSDFLETPAVTHQPSPASIPSDDDAGEALDSEPEVAEEEEGEEVPDSTMLSMPREPDDEEIVELEFSKTE